MGPMWQKFTDFLRRMIRRTPYRPPAAHVGGKGIPTIVGICEECGAVVVQGLDHRTAGGYRCRRCANLNKG